MYSNTRFDIFRLSKGEEGKGVFCTFTFVDVGTLSSQEPNRQAQELEMRIDEMKQKRDKERAPIDKKYEDLSLELAGKHEDKAAFKSLGDAYKKELADLEIKLIDEYRIFQMPGQEVTDQHTQRFAVPAKFFHAVVADSIKRPRAMTVRRWRCEHL